MTYLLAGRRGRMVTCIARIDRRLADVHPSQTLIFIMVSKPTIGSDKVKQVSPSTRMHRRCHGMLRISVLLRLGFAGLTLVESKANATAEKKNLGHKSAVLNLMNTGDLKENGLGLLGIIPLVVVGLRHLQYLALYSFDIC